MKALLEQQAEAEAKAAKDNTPFLLATASGVDDVVQLLMEARADVNARNANRKSGRQMAACSSGQVRDTLATAKAAMTHSKQSGRTRTGDSQSRQARYLRKAGEETAEGPPALSQEQGHAGPSTSRGSWERNSGHILDDPGTDATVQARPMCLKHSNAEV